MIIIGLTGGIATGKSTVSQMFEEYGVPVIDTDIIARKLLNKGSKAYDEIIEVFGEDILLTNGEISRKHLAKIIFEDEKLRNVLNSITHPKVKETVLHELSFHKNEQAPLVLVDVPLLYESGFDKLVDKVIVVATNKDKQLERLMDRDAIEKSYALSKIKSQMPLEDKIKKADYVIDNSLSIIQTKNEFLSIMKELEVK